METNREKTQEILRLSKRELNRAESLRESL